MKSLALGAALLLAFIFSTACDKKSGGGPTGPTPTVTSLALAPSTDLIITLVASQARDGVTGTIDFGDERPGAITGSIRPDGHLTLNGTYAVTIEVAGDLRVVTTTSATPARASSIGTSLLRRDVGRLEQRR
jgi:hypothetical protein